MAPTAFDAHVVPIFDGRFRIVFPIFDGTGALVTGATGLDSEVSKDQGAFVDCVNEAVEIAPASGIYRLDLTADEMGADNVTVQVKSTNGKTTVLPLSPYKLVILRGGTAQAGGASTITLDAGASSVDQYYDDCYIKIQNDTPAGVRGQTRRITDYIGATKVATVEGAWGTIPSAATTFFVVSHPLGHITPASIPAGAANKIADHVLRRTYANARASADGDAVAFRSLMGAIAHLVNRVAIAAGVKTVYHENDSTAFATAAITTNAAADPIVEVDPV